MAWFAMPGGAGISSFTLDCPSSGARSPSSSSFPSLRSPNTLFANLVNLSPTRMPRSGLRRLLSSVSRKNSQPTKMLMVKKMAATRFGNTYGNRSKNAVPRGFRGSTRSGLLNAPPSVGPTMAPTVYTKGITLNARGCNSFHGESSATVVRKIPTFPFVSPCSARAASAMGRLTAKPQSSIVHMVLNRPNRITGLRP